MENVFISYGRKESAQFAADLHRRLTEQGFGVWFDKEDIPFGVDYQAQIDDGIERAGNFIFIIAPHSVKSPYCRLEVELALRYRKRIIPLLHVMPSGDEMKQMHPAIGKINWIYFDRTELFDKSFGDLTTLIRSHTEYVHTHTDLLNSALAWKRVQGDNTALLLTDQRRVDAERWLRTKFDARNQAPCLPSDLHAEYITTSKKFAYNQYSDVFFCFDDTPETQSVRDIERQKNDTTYKDLPTALSIALQRNGITTWTTATDLRAGIKTETALHEAIEKATNFVYFLTNDTLSSPEYSEQLAYALECKKRIIPIYYEHFDESKVDANIKNLQRFNFSRCANDFSSIETAVELTDLLALLETDQDFYFQHKEWLSKAVQWDSQNRNSGKLLRLYNLEKARTWLDAARKRNKATPLQIEYIEESERVAEKEFSSEVFLFYSAHDTDFLRRFNIELQNYDKTTWVYAECIAPATDAQTRAALVEEGIKRSENFVVIASPNTLREPDFNRELDLARQMGKRVITVLYKDTDDLPAALQETLIDFHNERNGFATAFAEFIRALNTDREHVQAHTFWLQKALYWQQSDRNSDLLLHGVEFEKAREWYENSKKEQKKPAITELQSEFIEQSRATIEKRARRKRIMDISIRVGLVIMTIMFVASVMLWRYAQKQQDKAKAAQQQAERSFKRAQSNNLLVAAQKAEQSDATVALNLAQAAASFYDNTNVQQTIASIYYKNNFYKITDSTAAKCLAVSPDGTFFAVGYGKVKNSNNDIRLFDKNGIILDTLTGHTDAVLCIAITKDGQTIVSGSRDKTIKVWSRDGKELKSWIAHNGAVSALAVGSDSGRVVSASWDKTIRVWSLQGDSITVMNGHTQSINAIALSPTGDTVISASNDMSVRLWNMQGKQLRAFDTESSIAQSVVMSADGQWVAAGLQNNRIVLWTRDGLLDKKMSGHSAPVNALDISADGSIIVSGAADKTIRLWDAFTGSVLQNFDGHNAAITMLRFLPQQNRLISLSDDETTRLWLMSANRIFTVKGDYTAAAFVPVSNLLFVGTAKGSIEQYNMNAPFLNVSLPKAHTKPISSMAISNDGKYLLSAADDGIIKLWVVGSPTEAIKLDANGNKVTAMTFTKNATKFAIGYSNSTVSTYDLTGNVLWQHTESGSDIMSLAFDHTDSLLAIGYGSLLFGNNNGAAVFDATGNEVMRVRSEGAAVQALAFSPANQYLATGSSDYLLRIWNLQGKMLAEIKAHQAAITSLAYSADGSMLLSGGKDNRAKLWDASGNHLQSFTGHKRGVFGVWFSEKTAVVTVSNDMARYWTLKMPLDTFLHINLYEKLSFAQTLQYDIVSPQTLIDSSSTEGIQQAAQYYEELVKGIDDVAEMLQTQEYIVELYRKVIELQPSDQNSRNLAQALANRVLYELYNRQNAKSLTTANEAVKIYAQDALVQARLVLAHMYNDDETEAMNALSRAHDVNRVKISDIVRRDINQLQRKGIKYKGTKDIR